MIISSKFWKGAVNVWIKISFRKLIGYGFALIIIALLISGFFYPMTSGDNKSSNDVNSTSRVNLLEPGTYHRTLKFGGLERSFRIHVPVPNDRQNPLPLLLAFHGRGGTGDSMAKLSNLDELAGRKGFIVIYPEGIDRFWNAGHFTLKEKGDQVDDIGFVDKLIDELSAYYNIDHHRVYATGMSNGAMFVHRLACELSDKILAIAAVAGTIAPEIGKTCKTKRPVPVLQIHGTADHWVPWDGGVTMVGGRIESVSTTIRFWVENNHCHSEPRLEDLKDGVTRERYGPCEGNSEVILYRIDGGGHTWPGGYQYLPERVVGKTNRAINSTEEILEFFISHPCDKSIESSGESKLDSE